MPNKLLSKETVVDSIKTNKKTTQENLREYSEEDT